MIKYDVRLLTLPQSSRRGFVHGLEAGGVNVEPITVDEFRFGPGETDDVIVQPTDGAYTVFAQ